MRVYMAPDGTGRKYHKDNVPYKPEHWLRVAKEGLKKGDKIVTTGGIYGKITDIKDSTVTVEIADNVRVIIDKSAVVQDNTDLQAQK